MKENSNTVASIPSPLLANNRRVIKYGLIFTLLWLLLTNGEMNSWIIGIIVVPIATWLAVTLFRTDLDSHYTETTNQPINQPVYKMNPLALTKFIPFFLWQSLSSGWDTAKFAMLPNKKLKPGFILYKTQLPPGRPLLYFIHIISLLPGSFSTAIKDNSLLIHVLDTSDYHEKSLRECEKGIQLLFDLSPKIEGPAL